MAAPVSTNIINERPAIATDDRGCLYIATKYQLGGTGDPIIVVYKKCPTDSSFTMITIYQET